MSYFDSVLSRPILLVEDNADDVALTQRVVDAAGIRNRLQLAGTIQEAKSYLANARGEIDLPALLVLDLQLPDGTGLELLEWVRAQSPPLRDLPALVVTGSPDRAHQMRAERLGAMLFLQKPVDRTLLSAAIVHLGLRFSESQQGSLIEKI